MPLTNSVPHNIEHLLRKWKRTGKIGTSSPATIADAKKQAAAIAYDHERGGHGAKMGIDEYAEGYGRDGKRMAATACMSLEGVSDAKIEEMDSAGRGQSNTMTDHGAAIWRLLIRTNFTRS